MAGIPPIQSYPLPNAADLPVAIPDWEVDHQRVVLLVHDMQKYFVAPFPAGESPRQQLVPNIEGMIAAFRNLHAPVAYTAQPGSMTAEQRGLLKDFWGPGMRAEPQDRAVIEPLAPEPGDWTFTKWRYSAFFGSDLLARMRELGRDQLVVCGVYAHVGVLATAVEAFSNDIQTFMVADAVADFSAHQHQFALDYAAKCCAVVLTADQVLTGLVSSLSAAGRSVTA